HHRSTATGSAGYGQHRDPGLRRAGTERVQRALRVYLLSPLATVQSRRRRPRRQAAARQRSQRRGLGGTATARDRASTATGQGSGLPRRRGLCQAGAVRGAGRTGGEVRHSPSYQRQSGAEHSGVVDPASGKAELPAAGAVQELFLSGGELEDGTAGGGEGRGLLWGVVP